MAIRLSICIATYNRADYIAQTLDSIVPQLVEGVELVILDGASPDATAEVVAPYAARHPAVRYLRAPTNSGIDADFDNAVELARGGHCWLFSDDDLMAPGAIETVLNELADGNPDLIVVDAEVRDLNFERVFEATRLPITGRRDYRPEDRDAFLADAGNALTFIACVIIRRACWLERERRAFYGSLFVHVGVIFQQPLDRIRVLAQPLARIRMGNAMWSGRSFEIWMFMWPELIWSFAGYSDKAKAKVVAREPWHQFLQLLGYRAYGSFGRAEYRKFLAAKVGWREKLRIQMILALPGPVAHVLVMILSALSRHRHSSVTYNLLVASRNSNWLSCAIGRLIGHSLPPRQRRV